MKYSAHSQKIYIKLEVISDIKQNKTRERGRITRLECSMSGYFSLWLGTALLLITFHRAELNKSCNLGVFPVMNENLFRKNGTEHFFLVSACCKLFSFPCSLSAPVSRWHWAECNFTGKYFRGKSYHGMWFPDTALVKCIEVFQFKCICLSLGLNVECKPLIVSISLLMLGKSWHPVQGWWASAASQECCSSIGCRARSFYFKF